MDVTIIPISNTHAAELARALLHAAGPDRAHEVRTRSDVPGGLGFVVPADLAHTADPPSEANAGAKAAAGAGTTAAAGAAGDAGQPESTAPVPAVPASAVAPPATVGPSQDTPPAGAQTPAAAPRTEQDSASTVRNRGGRQRSG